MLSWLFSSNSNSKATFPHLLDEHLKNATFMETPITPGVNPIGLNKVQRNNKDDDDDEQSFYSAPPSRSYFCWTLFLSIFILSLASRQDDPLSLFSNRSMDKTSFPTTLENWFGDSIYQNAYPRMPSDHVLSASDLEQ